MYFQIFSNFKLLPSRPRRRRLEAFTTDSKIIPLINGRVAIFPVAAACQIFDGDCDAANRKKFRGDTVEFRPCVFLGKWTEVFPVDKISCIGLCHCTDCLFAVFEVI